MFANKKAARAHKLEYQHVLENYARTLGRRGITSAMLNINSKSLPRLNKERRDYLFNEDNLHSLVRLVSNPNPQTGEHFPLEKLQDLDTAVPLNYYATCHENGYDPMLLSHDAEHLGLDTNHWDDLKSHKSLPEWHTPRAQGLFGKPQNTQISAILNEGGLPQYVSCVKLGASHDDIHRVLEQIPREPNWRSNSLDLHFTRRYHPLGMLANLLQAPGGSTDEFLEHLKNSRGDSGYLSAVTTARMAGATKEQAPKLVQEFAKTPQLWKPYFEGARHRLSHEHLGNAITSLGPDRLDKYVESRLKYNLGHKQALKMIGGDQDYKVQEGTTRSQLKPLGPKKESEDYATGPDDFDTNW